MNLVNKLYLDGYNFIQRIPALSRTFENDPHAARERLKSILQHYAAQKKLHIIVVYDSADKRNGQGTVTSSYLFEEVFVKNADSYLRGVIDRSTISRTNRVTVVSSDMSDVYLPAKAHGARVLTSEEFHAELRKVNRKPKSVGEKPLPPKEEEIEEWIRYFESRDE